MSSCVVDEMNREEWARAVGTLVNVIDGSGGAATLGEDGSILFDFSAIRPVGDPIVVPEGIRTKEVGDGAI